MEIGNHILVVIRNLERAVPLTQVCAQLGIRMQFSPNAQHAMGCASSSLPTLVVVDVADIWLGNESIPRALGRDARLASIPILILTDDRCEIARRSARGPVLAWNDERRLRHELEKLVRANDARSTELALCGCGDNN